MSVYTNLTFIWDCNENEDVPDNTNHEREPVHQDRDQDICTNKDEVETEWRFNVMLVEGWSLVGPTQCCGSGLFGHLDPDPWKKSNTDPDP